jgi:hypothetical protein
MRVLRSIVQTSMLPVFDARHNLALSRTVAGEFIRDHHPRSHTLLLEQLAEQELGFQERGTA